MKKALQQLWAVVRSICAAAFGVRSTKGRLDDAKKAPLSGLIAGAVTFVLLFVFVLSALASWIASFATG